MSADDAGDVGMNAATIHDEVVVFVMPDGRRAVAVLPVIPDAAPPRIREGIARRRLAATTGECPCGATVDFEADHVGTVNVAEVLHDRRCPADTDRLVKAIRRWAA